MNKREKLRKANEIECFIYQTKPPPEEAFRLWHEVIELERSANEMTEDDDEPIAQESGELKPSQVTDRPWLGAIRRQGDGDYPQATEKSGKLLIYVSVAHVDEVWAKIKKATEEGRLGGSSKVSTARPHTKYKSKVICVYTYDGTDNEDVNRIRRELCALGIKGKLPYKLDKDTRDGKYAD